MADRSGGEEQVIQKVLGVTFPSFQVPYLEVGTPSVEVDSVSKEKWILVTFSFLYFCVQEEFAEWQRKFDEVIDELPAYGPTLARIKVGMPFDDYFMMSSPSPRQKQYEAVIGFIIDSKRVRTLVQLDRDKKTKENQTIR